MSEPKARFYFHVSRLFLKRTCLAILCLLSLTVAFSRFSHAQTKEYIYIGGRLVAIEESSGLSVTVTAPTSGQTFTFGATINLAAFATPPSGGSISAVRFKAGGNLLTTINGAGPYTFAWANAPIGSHNLTAEVTAVGGEVQVSSVVPITVVACGAPVIQVQPNQGGGCCTILSGQYADLSVVASGLGMTYQWYRGTSGNTTQPITGATLPNYRTPTLSVTTNYWVRIRNWCGTTENIRDSTTVTVTVSDSSPPSPPGYLTAVGAPGSYREVDLTWSSGSGAHGYRVRRRGPQETDFTLIWITGTSGFTYRDKGLTPGDTYVYRVAAFNNAGESAAVEASVQLPILPDLLVEAQTITAGAAMTFKAANSITVRYVTVQPNAEVWFRAGQRITFGEGFVAMSGSRVHTLITATP